MALISLWSSRRRPRSDRTRRDNRSVFTLEFPPWRIRIPGPWRKFFRRAYSMVQFGLRNLQDLPHDALELSKLRRLPKLFWRERRRLYSFHWFNPHAPPPLSR